MPDYRLESLDTSLEFQRPPSSREQTNWRSQEIIRGYSAIYDHEKIGFQLTAITEVSVAKGKLLELEREVAKMQQVIAVYDVTGLTDAIVIAKFRSREDLSKFTKALLAMPFVERTNRHIVLTTVKEDFRLL